MTLKRGIIVIMCLGMLTACKQETLKEVLKKDVPFKINSVVHIEEVKAGVIVLYTTKQKNEKGSFEALSVAFLKGSEKDGWENAGHNHWDYYENRNMTVYPDTFYDYDDEGRLEHKIPMIYGEIKNKEIDSVEVAVGEKKYEKAKLIYHNQQRYFIKMGEYKDAKGVGKDGKIIEKKVYR